MPLRPRQPHVPPPPPPRSLAPEEINAIVEAARSSPAIEAEIGWEGDRAEIDLPPQLLDAARSIYLAAFAARGA